MKAVVADASLCGAWILDDEASAAADRLLQDILSGQSHLIIPALWHYEMTNLLRSAVRRKRLSEDDAQTALETLAAIPLYQEDQPDPMARNRLFHLSRQFSLSAYDAAYLELADRLKIPLLTGDQALQKAARHLGLPE